MATEVHMHGRIGESIKRKEDGRFLRGKGNYLDDIELPAMLHMVILRSPHAHARINSVDTAAASAMPGVIAVVTGELMAQHKLAWMPTLSYDTQAVLATDKVRFQGQEVAAVVAETKAQAEDARDAIIVDYDVLPAVISPQQAQEANAVVIRDDKENQKDNYIYHWEAGDQATTQAAFAKADKVVRLHTFYPRCHPAPLETCGCIADVNGATGKATIYMTSQAPHAIRTVFALVTGLPEQNIRVISPDIGGGFGNKVPVYPGYVVATAASLLIGRPVKWVEDRNENLISTGFARDFHMTGDLALDKNGKMLALRVHLDSDNGAFFADAQPTKFKAGLFHIVTGSYDIPTAHVTADGYYTNKAPGGVAYRCSFRVTEASYLIERLVTNAAIELGMDQAEFRMKNFIRPEQFPYHSATGWEYDSGDYPRAMNVALEQLGYDEMRKDVEARRKKGEVTGIGIASFTEVVGAGHGAEDRFSPARGCRGGPRVGERQVLRQGFHRPGEDDPGDRVCRLLEHSRGHGGGARRRSLLRPAEHDVSVRHVRGRGRHRQRHRPGQGPSRGRGRRLRRADQPDDRRGPDPRRTGRRLRHRVHGADHLRRGGQLHRLQLHGLPAADGVGDAPFRAR